jgi:NADH-quinone oxidoreductase subunit F
LAPLRLQGKNGHVSQLICQQMSLGEFDSSGRKKPVPCLGSTITMDVDQVILAVGQTIEDSLDMQKSGITLSKGGLIAIEKGLKTQTSIPMVFAGGDVVTGPDTVVGAIAAGHQAAREIDGAIRLRNGESPYADLAEEKGDIPIEIPMEVEAEIQERYRTKMPELDAANRISGFQEVELGFTEEIARIEAGRCLRCDIEVEENT